MIENVCLWRNDVSTCLWGFYTTFFTPSSIYSVSFMSSWSEVLEISSSVCSPEKYNISACVLWVTVTVQGPWAHGSPSTCIGIIEHFKISWIREQINRKTSVPKKLRQVFLNNDLYHPKSLNLSFKDISYHFILRN